MLLKHPVTGRVVDVSDRRAKTLRARGYVDADVDVTPTSAVQPQPPIDARPNPPEPPTEMRPDDMITSPPIDTRPPNPQGPVAESVEDADGSVPVDSDDDQDAADGPPAQSASKPEWVAYAEAQGVEDADSYTKQQLIDRVG